MEKFRKSAPESSKRRKRTRTLIQIGGLVEKAGLLEDFGIAVGDDLQDNVELQSSVAELCGAMLEIKTMIENNEHSPALWRQAGKERLGKL